MSLVNDSYPLKELNEGASVYSGFAFKSKDFVEEGIPVVKIKNIQNKSVDLSDIQFFSQDNLNEKHEKFLLKNNDVLIAMTGQGSLGRVGRLKLDNEQLVLLNQRVGKFITDEKNLHLNYLYHIISSDMYEKILFDRGTGSGQPNLSPEIILGTEIPMPDFKTQKKIAMILDTIDDLITLNKRINKNLEQYLFYIFDKTFMNFEFNEFSNSHDKIPQSWNLGRFNDIIDSLGSGDWGKDELTGNYTSEVYCIRGADIPDVKQGNKGKMPIRYILPKNFKNKKLTENTIVLEISGGSPTQSTGRTVFITKDFLNRFDKDLICTNFCKVIKPTDNYEIFLYLYFNYLYDKDVMFAYENGTTGIKNFDIKSFINNFLIVIPSQEDIINFNKLVRDVFDIIMHNGLEIEKLQRLRDTLLPKLMSGEIDVSKINCDLKYGTNNLTLKLKNKLIEVVNMKTKIISKIQNQMKPYLNQGQYIKLTNSLLNSLQNIDIIDNNNELSEVDNFKLLNLFLSAKQVEGCSDKTIKYYKSTIEKMLMKIKKQIYNINTDDLRKYLFDHKYEKQSSKTTIDNLRRIFSSFFSWLEDEDYIVKNPVRRIHRVKIGRVVKEVLTDENLETLRDNCQEIRDLAMVELLISTGIRVGELVNLNIEDIDFYERECVVFGKGESERVVYFDARTKIHLLEYIQSRNDENPALFVSLNKPHYRLGVSGIETRLRELGKKCNINKVHPHKFRRTMATNAIDKGMPIEQVQKLLGHVQIDTTMKYAMVNQSNVKLAHRKYIG